MIEGLNQELMEASAKSMGKLFKSDEERNHLAHSLKESDRMNNLISHAAHRASHIGIVRALLMVAATSFAWGYFTHEESQKRKSSAKGALRNITL